MGCAVGKRGIDVIRLGGKSLQRCLMTNNFCGTGVVPFQL